MNKNILNQLTKKSEKIVKPENIDQTDIYQIHTFRNNVHSYGVKSLDQ